MTGRASRTTDWRQRLRRLVEDPGELLGPGRRREQWRQVTERYPLRLSPAVLRLVRAEGLRGPVSRQVLPDRRELAAGGKADPLDEEKFMVAPGLVRRFPDRLLALVSASCASNCRHCNRKRYWQQPPQLATPETLAAAVRRTGSLREVILSGGDPLLLGDRQLARLLAAARARPGIEVVRLHTRAPFSLPERITPALVRLLRRHRPLWVLVQFNHASELTPATRRALAALVAGGIPVLNQGVLLRGVNDSVGALLQLGRALVRCGVKPHYLFCLDRAQGVGHFAVSRERAAALARALQGSSGLLVPRFMEDLPGRAGKQPLAF